MRISGLQLNEKTLMPKWSQWILSLVKRIKRGLYRDADGREINADLNGSANILRKAFHDAFREDTDCNNIWVLRHPALVLA